MLDAEILTTFSLVSPNPADLGWFPLGLSWRWGVISLHLHWYKIPFSLTAISSVLSEAILTNRNRSLALDFSGQNSRSSPSHNGVWFAPESPAEIIGINKNTVFPQIVSALEYFPQQKFSLLGKKWKFPKIFKFKKE